MPIRFVVKIVRLNVYVMTSASPTDDLDCHSRSQMRLKDNYFLTCNMSDNISAIPFKLGITVDVWMPYMLMLVSMTLALMQGHSGSAKAKTISVACSRQLSKQ